MTTQTERVSDERMHPDLASLLERVKAATGPDADLDVEIMAALLPKHKKTMEAGFDRLVAVAWEWRDFAWRTTDRIPYTASIDAALALVERLRPWVPWVDISGMNKRPDRDTGVWKVVLDGGWEGRAQTLPLAILSALLCSLINPEPSHV